MVWLLIKWWRPGLLWPSWVPGFYWGSFSVTCLISGARQKERRLPGLFFLCQQELLKPHFCSHPNSKEIHTPKFNIRQAEKYTPPIGTVSAKPAGKWCSKEEWRTGDTYLIQHTQTKLLKRDTMVYWWHYCSHQTWSFAACLNMEVFRISHLVSFEMSLQMTLSMWSSSGL